MTWAMALTMSKVINGIMPPGMFEWGVQKSWGGLGVLPQEKKKV